MRVVKIDERMLGGTKAATTMTSGKNDTNALPGERDAPVDELDLEHPFPDPPHQSALEPLAPVGDACAHRVEPSSVGRAFVSHLS